MKRILTVVMAVAFMGACGSYATDAAKLTLVQKGLTGVPAAEMPAKAGEIVKASKVRDRGTTTVEVVREAIQMSPAAAPAVVGGIARTVPDMASVAAGTAAELEPKQASDIARAAAVAAPSKAARIVVAVCRSVPQEYRNVAQAVAEVAPGYGREILRAVGVALPELKSGIESAMSGYSASSVSVATVLNSAATTPAAMTPTTTAGTTPFAGAKGATVSSPYVPFSSTGTNIVPSSSGQVPKGGRNYAQP